VVRDAQDAKKELAAALLWVCGGAQAGVVLVLTHAGARRATFADGLRGAGASVTSGPITHHRERSTSSAMRSGVWAACGQDAAEALLAAVGTTCELGLLATGRRHG
jgi:hypothetical protein